MTDTAHLTPEEQTAGVTLAGVVSNALQTQLLDVMAQNTFAGARNAVLNGALWALCAVAKSARDADPNAASEKPLAQVIHEQATLFLAAMDADDAMGIEQGTA